MRTRKGEDAVAAVEALISGGAGATLRDSTGRTPLLMCAERGRESWNLKEEERFGVMDRRRKGSGEEKKEGSGGGEGGENDAAEEVPSPKDGDVHWGAQVAQCLLTAVPTTVDLVGGPGKVRRVVRGRRWERTA